MSHAEMSHAEMSRGLRFHLVVYSDAQQLGGAEQVVGRLIEGLPPGITVTLVGVNAAVLEWVAARRPGTRTELIEPIADKTDVRGMWRTRTLLARLRPDIVQFNLSTMSSCQWALVTALTLRGVSVVVTENSPMGTWSALSTRLKRWTSRRLAGHIANGAATARTVERAAGLAPGSVQAVYHGVPDHHGTPPPRLDERPVVGTIARHDPVKGVDVLIEAAALPPLAGARIVLIGEGSETPSLRALAERLGVDEASAGPTLVEFRTLPYGAAARDHLAGFDVFVLPSRLEGVPVTVLEAMFAAVPIVTTDVGAVREVVTEGATARIVPPEDPTAIATAVAGLLAARDEARAMGARARQVALERFTPEATVAAYLEVYGRALRRSIP